MGTRTLGLQALARGLLAGLLLASTALPARAGEEPPVRLGAADWSLLPINELEKRELARDHPELVGRATVLATRRQSLARHLATRENPDDDAGRKIAAQIRQLDAEIAPLLARAIAALDDEVIDDALLRRIATAPRGPMRGVRYAMGLALFVDGVPAMPRMLLGVLLPRVEGALLSLEAQKQSLRKGAASDGSKQRLAELDARQRLVERRWWSLVDYIVPDGPRAALHRRLPSTHQRIESPFQHIYALPGLTTSQGARLRAMLKEIEAEASPDQAAARRLQKTPESQRDAKLRREAKEAMDRLTKLQRWAVDQAKRILTPEQWIALEAIPPRVSYQDRTRTSPQILEGTILSLAQKRKLAAWRSGLEDVRREYREKRTMAGARMAGMSPDAPEMASAQMQMAQVQAQAYALQRKFNGRLFLELLTPEQTTQWILGLTGGKR